MTTYTIHNSVIERAKITDPVPYLEYLGFYVRKPASEKTAYVYLDGFTKIGKEDIRISLKRDGHWISCFHDNTPIGSNINLALNLSPELDVIEAARLICRCAGINTGQYFGWSRLAHGPDGATMTPAGTKIPWPASTDMPPPSLPSEAGIAEGTSYLLGRGISAGTIDYAREAGFLRFLKDGIVFCGYDKNGVLRCATKRATGLDAWGPHTKRELRGSVKAYAPVLPGNPAVASPPWRGARLPPATRAARAVFADPAPELRVFGKNPSGGPGRADPKTPDPLAPRPKALGPRPRAHGPGAWAGAPSPPFPPPLGALAHPLPPPALFRRGPAGLSGAFGALSRKTSAGGRMLSFAHKIWYKYFSCPGTCQNKGACLCF
jgi:hypothetical protein